METTEALSNCLRITVSFSTFISFVAKAHLFRRQCSRKYQQCLFTVPLDDAGSKNEGGLVNLTPVISDPALIVSFSDSSRGCKARIRMFSDRSLRSHQIFL